MNSGVDIRQPRECIYQEFEDHPGPCPRCGAALQQIRQSYLVATRRGNQIANSFIVCNDMGWFCANCPTVVINPQQVAKMFQFTKPGWDIGAQHAVVGIIDLDAVPPDQKNLPFDEIDPMPLVEFSNWQRKVSLPKPASPRKTSQLQSAWASISSKRKKKRR